MEQITDLKYLLKSCADFQHTETLIINFRSFEYGNGGAELPADVCEYFPKTMRRIQNLEIHVFEKFLFLAFKAFDFSNCSYRIKIFLNL